MSSRLTNNVPSPSVASQVAFKRGIDGAAESWRLPLRPLNENSPEPSYLEESAVDDRVEAAAKVIGNAKNVVAFAARGSGRPGNRLVAARLSDPTATPDKEAIAGVDAALRRVCHELLEGTAAEAAAAAAKGVGVGVDVSVGMSERGAHDANRAAVSLAYLRDRVGVPRDLRYPAARQLRAHLNWFIDALYVDSENLQ
jgi:glutathione S-transferase